MVSVRVVNMSASKLVPPQMRVKMLVDHAREKRDALIKEGRASPSFITYVDGREGADERTVSPDHGIIRYVFSNIASAVAFARAMAISSSPRLDGDFHRKWFVFVNGSLWRKDLASIPSGATANVMNLSDYARIIEVGQRTKLGLGHKLVQKVVANTKRRFKGMRIELMFMEISGGYTLKTTSGRRKSQQAGAHITYPSIRISQV